MATTILTVSLAQMTALRAEAAAAGDVVQRIICDMAIDGEDSAYDAECLDEEGRPDCSGGGGNRIALELVRRALRLSQAEAVSACVAAIRSAEAAGDDDRNGRITTAADLRVRIADLLADHDDVTLEECRAAMHAHGLTRYESLMESDLGLIASTVSEGRRAVEAQS